jgi:hypothetical protein
MTKRFIIALLLAASFSGVATAACTSGFISIIDPFLNPNATPWSGSIVYTLAYNTTVSGATIVGARQQFNVTNGINLCLAPGLYSPVSLQQGGFSYTITNSWGVPTSGGPYTIAQIQGNITLQSPALLSSTVMLTQAQLLALQTVPVILVPAPAANQIIEPTLCISQQVTATTSTSNQFLQIGYGSIGSFHGIDSFGMLSGMGGTYMDSTIFFGILNGPSSNYAGQPLIGYADDMVSQPDGPSGNAYITTYYVLFQVGT